MQLSSRVDYAEARLRTVGGDGLPFYFPCRHTHGTSYGVY